MIILSKLLDFVKQYQHEVFLALCVVLISFTSYNLGKMSAFQKSPIKVHEGANIYKAVSVQEEPLDNANSVLQSVEPIRRDYRVVVSKNSASKRYHFQWCSGAKMIKEENKVWFNSEQEAISAGYSLAGNCER